MPHEIERVLRACCARVWAIEPNKGRAIAEALAARHANGPRAERYAERPAAAKQPAPKRLHVVNLMGTIMPRANITDLSDPGGAYVEDFMAQFRRAADDEKATAIVLNIDSPGGAIDLVPEAAEMIAAARNPDRPIIAIANTMAASAAYWIASSADEVVVTPSGVVGSIGVYMLHEDISGALAQRGISPTFIFEGARKVEWSPFGPLAKEAKAALQSEVRIYYEMFTEHVAKMRGVSVDKVRADPEENAAHFGGGRTYPAKVAVRLGMADRVDTIGGVLSTLVAAPAMKRATVSARRRRLSLAR